MKNNKLIAEFMGLPKEKVGLKQEVIYGLNQDDWYTPDNLNYHLSWDWLMPVVIKIGGTQNILGAMRKLRPYGVIHTLDDVYKAVVEFIKEDNKEYKTCDKCSYDKLDDNGDVLEHYCEDDELHTSNN
tara:strand:- start:487 stop:870 length:384 start_codon:yes stop_codon:yes gene_type:complete